MENKKKAKVDYAAIIREFEMYGRGRSLKQFCAGVEAYKKNMFALLGKKGYEQRKKYLEGRM